VADYRPATTVEQKIKKGPENLVLELVKTPDILEEAQGPFIKVGFAAESEALLANAREKLERKNLDLIVANQITASDSGFGVDTNQVELIHRSGKVESLPLMLKTELADLILDRVVSILRQTASAG